MERKEEGKKEGPLELATGETAAATPDTYRVGSGAWWGICPAGSLGKDYYHLYRSVRASPRMVGSVRARGTRAVSLPLGQLRRTGPTRLFLGPRPSVYSTRVSWILRLTPRRQ